MAYGRVAASQKGRTPRTNAVGHHPEVVRAVGVDAVAACEGPFCHTQSPRWRRGVAVTDLAIPRTPRQTDLEHDLALEFLAVRIQIILQRLEKTGVRVLEGQDHGRLVRFIIVRFYAEFARAGLYYFMLDDVLFLRAREAREAPGGGRRECQRQDEAARRHRALIAVVLQSVLTNAAAADSFPRLLALQLVLVRRAGALTAVLL